MTAARRLHKRAFRERDQAFLAEGPQAVREALAAGVAVEVFVTAEAAQRHPEVAPADGPVTRVSGQVLAALAQTVAPQGVVAVCRPVDVALPAVTAARSRLVAVLAEVRDPGNAGTVIRAADAAGADAVVLAGRSVDLYNGKTVRATAGSLFHLPVVTGVPTAAALAGLRAGGCRVLAADGAGDTALDAALDGGDLARPVAWVFGNEAWGLPDEVRALADAVVRVPIRGRAESLNLGTAAAVCLYATAYAQRGKGRGDG